MVTSFFNHKKKTLPGRNATITSSGIWGSCHPFQPRGADDPRRPLGISEVPHHMAKMRKYQ